MRTIHSVLVPVDFSPSSANAFQYALRLADRLGASIDLLYAIPPTTENPGYGSFVNTLTATLREHAETDMGGFLRQGFSEAAPDLERVPAVHTFIRVGELRTAVREQVEREDNQLIVMGTHGRQDAWDDVLGTNTSSLVAAAPCPLLIIPSDVSFTPIRALCYATDLHHVDVFRAGHLLRVLHPFDPALHFFHVRSGGDEATEFDLALLNAVFNRPGMTKPPTFVSRVGEDVPATVFEYARENHCDLVVMNRPDKNWLSRLFGKSNTKRAARHATLPLLIVRPTHLRAPQDTPATSRRSTVR